MKAPYKTSIVLFSDDFRIKDNPALTNACLQSDFIIPVYIYDENYLGRSLGKNSKIFLHYVLDSFSKLLHQKYGGRLIIRKGNRIEELKKIINESNAFKVFFNRSYTLKEKETEKIILETFNAESFKAKTIFEGSEIKHFKVFTPFWKECLASSHLARKLISEPASCNIKQIPSLAVSDLNLLTENNLLNYWEFDYEKIEKHTQDFLNTKLTNYKEDRNFPALNSTSKLSSYIRFGVISPNVLFWEGLKRDAFFTSELGWREFAFASLHYFKKNLWEEELKQEFSNFEFEENPEFFEKWKQGKTGEGLVDAGMKELYETGYMHNRVRMLSASYLIKDLFIKWKLGEEWFWQNLCDACPAVNPFSWQWVFGSGYDASPFFRIFNPDLQLQKFDPTKEYTNKWISNSFNFKLVNHEDARKKALTKYSKITKSS